jgi:GNAT superfamily N-acetyltransferase
MMTFKEFLQERTSRDAEIEALENKIRSECSLEKFWLYHSGQNPDIIGLQLIVVGKDSQGSGQGTKAMKMLCDYADEHGLIIALSPSERNKHIGTTSKTRLIEFYGRFGFVKNTGNKKHPRVSATMYRAPKR